MKRIVSLLLAVAMSVSAVPTAFAADTQDHSLGTQVVFTAANNENYTITVPASLNPGQSGTVTLDGYWPDSKTVTVTAEKTVTLKNSIKAADTKTLNVTFLGISEAGSNTSKQTFTEPVSVEGISNALFGTWSGKFNYNVDSVEEEVPPAENYIGTVSADNTITLSGVESAGTYTLRYANANGALENYADICSLEVTDPATAVSYDDLIAENCAPVEATSIAVYNASNEKVGDIALGGLNPNLGTKLYSFGALADTHIGDAIAETKVANAFTYLTETEQVAFTCIPGDLTNNVTEANVLTLQNLINTYSTETPVHLSFGNHDSLRNYDNQNVDTLKLFEEITGTPLYYSFTHGDDVFIMVGLINGNPPLQNSPYQEYWSIFTAEEMQWLYKTLEANKDKRCFVFQHIFPYEEGCGNAGDFYDTDTWNGFDKTAFEGLLKKYHNVTFFHGHSHTMFEGQAIDDMANYDHIRGSHSVHIPSVTKPRTITTGEQSFDYSQGYVVDVYENAIVLRGRDFEADEFLPIAQYVLDTSIKEISTRELTLPVDLQLEYGVKIDKANGTTFTADNCAASRMIEIKDDVSYRLGMTVANGSVLNVCCYDKDGNYIGCVPDVIIGPGSGTYEPQELDLETLDGTAYIRLRYTVPASDVETATRIYFPRYYLLETFTA